MEESVTALQKTKKGFAFPNFEKISEKQNICNELVQEMCPILLKEGNASSINRLEQENVGNQ